MWGDLSSFGGAMVNPKIDMASLNVEREQIMTTLHGTFAGKHVQAHRPARVPLE